MKKTKYEIEGHPGVWTIKNSWISDLGFIMIAFWSEERGVTMNVNTRTTLEQALKLPWAHYPEETKDQPKDII